jgi:hypothetical protein
MRFSEAMRLGAMLGKQLKGHRRFNGSPDSCAIGAAELGIGLESWERAEHVWPWLCEGAPDPVTGQYDEIRIVVASLNNGWHNRMTVDAPQWTREEIARWVETLPQDQIPALENFTQKLNRKFNRLITTHVEKPQEKPEPAVV